MRIFVGNLSRDITDDDLRGAFSAYGKVANITVMKDKFTGEPRGFGFVEMEAKSDGQAAISGLNGKPLKGRTLTVNEARPRSDGPPRGGFGGRGGMGGPRGGGGAGRGGWRQ